MIHIFLVGSYATEADARQAASTMPEGTPYRGVWKMPTPEQPIVHAFCHHTSDELGCAGWTPVDTETSSSEAVRG